jgi:5-methylcytosine-specific restriction enzyme subunit McrC
VPELQSRIEFDRAVQNEASSLADPIHTQRRRVFPAVEYEPVEVPLAELITNDRLEVYPQVRGRDFFRMYLKEDRLVFQAGGFIGLIPINDRVALDVRSRVPVRNLERILRIADHMPLSLSPYFRRYESHPESAPSLIDLLAESLIAAVDEIGVRGIQREYFQRTNDTSFPRGRILMGETMKRHVARGINYRATASWFESSVDTGLNRSIKYSIWYLAQRYESMMRRRGLRKMTSNLARIYQLFGAVQLDKSRKFLRDPLVIRPENIPALRSYYLPALHLAITIIRDRGLALETKDGDIIVPSLLIDLQSSFEAYLRAVLRSGMKSIAPEIRVLDGNVAGAQGGRKLLFDSLPSESANPDIVCRRDHEPTHPVLIEVKYKKMKSPERDDINQAISYGASYRSPHVVIAHPLAPGGKHGLQTLGKITPVAFYQYAFDLSVDDPELEEAKFAASIHGLIESVPPIAAV